MALDKLPHNPIGWFAVARSAELKLGDIKQGWLCDSDYYIRREKDGSLFFNGSVQAIKEQNGFILAWHHPNKEKPSWFVPELDMQGWRKVKTTQLSAKTHPQEVFENSIDLAHFPLVHDFSDIHMLQEPEFTQQSMRVRYQINRASPFFWQKAITPKFEVLTHGIGCSHNHIYVPQFGMHVRMFVFATPTQNGQIEIRLGISIHKKMDLPLSSILAPIIHIDIAKNVVHDFCQDIDIWENKRYCSPPVLTRNDGPIGKFRQWCLQYYVENATETAQAAN